MRCSSPYFTRNPMETGVSKDFPHLFAPIQVGPIELRNRILVTAHVPRLADDTVPGERYVAYHRARAKGGVALQMTGATPVHPSSGRSAANALENTDDRIIPGYRKLSEAVRAEGGRVLAQLAHYGATITSNEPGQPIWSPSGIGSDLNRAVPHEMTKREISEVITAFGEAARRARDGDMDGVEILGAFGLLIAAFLSPKSNRRSDSYGGSLQNRLRLALEITDAVREAVGPDRIVGMRIPGDEFTEGGLDLAAMREIAPRLEETGKLDYLNIAAGNNLDRVQRTTHWPPTPAPHGLFVPLASGIREVVSLPVFAVGRIVDPRHAERILEAGEADMVGMTRAHIADPDLVSKTREGRADEIRPCVGANVCIARAMAGSRIACLNNPEAAREHELGPPKPARRASSIAVIGGGPAGLEAAGVLAERGHRVTLYEASKTLGGQFALRTAIPHWEEFRGVLDWQTRRLERLQVTQRLGRRLEPDDIADLEADAVILATGAVPNASPFPDVKGCEIVSPHDLIHQGKRAFTRVVVHDRGGGTIGTGAIEYLAALGADVTIVTPAFMVAEDIDMVQRVPFYERILAAGASFMANHEVVALEDAPEGTIVLARNVYTNAETRIGPICLLVDWRGGRSVADLVPAMEERGLPYIVVGDGLAPRTADIAIAEGMMAARDIDRLIQVR